MEITHINSNVEFDQKRRNGKKEKHKKKRFKLKFLLLFIFVVTITVSIAISPICNLDKIVVQGSQKYKDDDIISSAEIYKGVNTFKILWKNIEEIRDVKYFCLLRYGNAERNILKSHPYIKEVFVKLLIPNQISISISERSGVCILPYLGNYILMDKEGYILDTIDRPDKKGLPLLKGISFEGFELGQALNVKNPQSIEDTVGVLDAIEDSDKNDKFKIFDILKTIDVNDTKKIYLLLDDRIVVNIGDLKDISYKLNFLKQIYLKKISKEEKGLLDFSTGENPNFIPEKR